MIIIYIMGKSSSGKDTIYNILKEKLDIDTYVSYTTRPIREGETDGVTYHYISDKEIAKYDNNNKIIEKRTYQTVYGPWTYATISDEQFNSGKDLIMLGTLESYNEMKKYFSKKLLPIYIEVEDGVRLERALKREQKESKPKYEELCRRFLADAEDFSEENIQKAKINKRFQNIDLDKCIEEIVEYINKEKQEK